MNRGDKARMKKVLVIGIGVGDPDQLTVQAVQALNRVDVFFVMDKGTTKGKLRAVREEILRRHVIRSPVRGVVVHRYLSPGESAEDRPILRIAEIETLRAEAIIPVAQFGTVQVGQRAIVVPEEPLTGHYVGTVSVVDRVADAASGTFRARVLLDNPDYALPSGLRCAVRFLQPGESVADNIPSPPASRPLSRAALQSSRPRDLAAAPSSTTTR